MNSFNVYGQTEKKVGGNTPVWLGTVKPIPVGARINLPEGSEMYYPAGSPVFYEANTNEATVYDISRMENANAFLYNDVYSDGTSGTATCAIVMHHPEGLLIERVLPEITGEQIVALQAKIPGVLLVRG